MKTILAAILGLTLSIGAAQAHDDEKFMGQTTDKLEEAIALLKEQRGLLYVICMRLTKDEEKPQCPVPIHLPRN